MKPISPRLGQYVNRAPAERLNRKAGRTTGLRILHWLQRPARLLHMALTALDIMDALGSHLIGSWAGSTHWLQA